MGTHYVRALPSHIVAVPMGQRGLQGPPGPGGGGALPAGGVAGDTLVKQSSTAGDATWQPPVPFTPTGSIKVASLDADAADKAASHYVCDGTNDEVQIQAAIDQAAPLASRNAGMPAGAEQVGQVVLSGGRFNIGAPIQCRTGVEIIGKGFGTEVRAVNNNGTAVFVLAAVDDHAVGIRDMYINGNASGGGTCSGIDFDMTASGNTSDYPDTNPDSYHNLSNLMLRFFNSAPNRHSVHLWATSTANNRANYLHNIRVLDCSGRGIWLKSASDSFISDCHVGSCTDTAYYLETSNTKVSNCKSFYCDQYGFFISGQNCTITGCEAQDDHIGFHLSGSYMSAGVLTADTCELAGIQINVSSGMSLAGFQISHRVGGRYATQTNGLQFVQTPTESMIVGRVRSTGITNKVVGTVGAQSFMRVMDGATVVLVDRTATSSAVGVVRFATNSETITGTATDLATTPAGVGGAIDDAINEFGNTLPTTYQARSTLGEDVLDEASVISALGAKADTASLPETILDTVAGGLLEGAGIDIAYDDPAGTITVTATGGAGGEPLFEAYEDSLATVHVLPDGINGALGTTFQDALNTVQTNGGGKIVFPAGSFTLATAVTYDAINGPLIISASGTTITYSGSGVMATFLSSSSTTNFGGVQIDGGNWVVTGSATGVIRIQDLQGTVLNRVRTNGHTAGFGVELRNMVRWTENTKIDGCSFDGRNAIVFTPQSISGGSGGTESFARTRVNDCWVGGGASAEPKFHIRGGVYGTSFTNIGGNIPHECEVYRFSGTSSTPPTTGNPAFFFGTVIMGSQDFETVGGAGTNACIFRDDGANNSSILLMANFHTTSNIDFNHATEPAKFSVRREYNAFDILDRDIGDTPQPPAEGFVRIFGRDGELCQIDSAGIITVLSAGGGGGSSVVDQSLTVGTVSNSTAKATAGTINVPAGMGVGDGIFAVANYEWVNTTAAAANFKTILDVGPSGGLVEVLNQQNTSVTNHASNTRRGSMTICATVISSTVIRLLFNTTLGLLAAPGSVSTGNATSSWADVTVANTAAAWDIVLSFQMGTADAGLISRLNSFTAWDLSQVGGGGGGSGTVTSVNGVPPVSGDVTIDAGDIDEIWAGDQQQFNTNMLVTQTDHRLGSVQYDSGTGYPPTRPTATNKILITGPGSEALPAWATANDISILDSRIDQTLTPVTVSNTAVKTTLGTITVPAGSAPGDAFQIRGPLTFNNDTAGAVNFELFVDVGGTTVMDGANMSVSNSTTTLRGPLNLWLTILSATTFDLDVTALLGNAAPTGTLQTINIARSPVGYEPGTLTNTALTFDIVISIRMASASTSITTTLHHLIGDKR